MRWHPKDRRYGAEKYGSPGCGVLDAGPIKGTEWLGVGYYRTGVGNYRLVYLGPGLVFGPTYRWEGSLLKDLGQQAYLHGWSRA